MAVLKRSRPAPRRPKLGTIGDFKKVGWKVSRGRKSSKGGFTASKRGVTVCAVCKRSLLNRMMAAEVVGRWKK